MTTGEACDVVVVPDFTNENRAMFEARTLFFLASWLDHAGTAAGWPLHVACIGEPPGSVRRLAERCSASVTVHEPLFGGRVHTNKLRGLEIEGRTDRVLLLDADVLVLSDISRLAELGCCLAAAPSLKPRIPTSAWRAVYRELGIELPTERIKSVRGTVAAAAAERWYQSDELEAMVPYYNGGIILAPWRCDLRSLWEEHLRLIAEKVHQAGDAAAALTVSDQAALATAIQALRQRGFAFTDLPTPCHAHYLYLYKRTVPFGRIKLFHAFGFAGGFRGNGEPLSTVISGYRARLQRDFFHEWRLDPGGRALVRYVAPALKDAARLAKTLYRLHDRHIRQVCG